MVIYILDANIFEVKSIRNYENYFAYKIECNYVYFSNT